MKKNNQRKVLIVLVCGLLVVALAACGKKPEQGAGEKPGQEVNAGDNGSSAPSDSPDQDEVQSGSGVYVGQADPHTVEITVDGQATAFQLGTIEESVVQKLSKDDQVEFKYTEKAIEGEDELKQLILTEIAKKAE